MNTIHRSAIVNHSAQQMFNLINDVENYKHFLPWCGDSALIQDNKDERIASVTIAFKGIHKTFTTRNTLKPYQSISLGLIDGPFSNLQGIWRFKTLDKNACKVTLNLEFDFSNRVVGMVIEPVFTLIANSMLDSFVSQADKYYASK